MVTGISAKMFRTLYNDDFKNLMDKGLFFFNLKTNLISQFQQ